MKNLLVKIALKILGVGINEWKTLEYFLHLERTSTGMTASYANHVITFRYYVEKISENHRKP